MPAPPRGMKTKFTLRDRITMRPWWAGVICFSVVTILAWAFARAFPEKGWFTFLVPPIPMDNAPFIIGHAWVGYFMGKWWYEKQMYKNPQVFTKNGHFATSPKHFRRVGPWVIIPRGMLDESLTSKGYATEGWLVTLAAFTTPLDKDWSVPVREFPCALSGLAPIVVQEFRSMGCGPDEEIYFGFPDEYMIPNEESTAKAIDVLRMNDKVNKWLEVDDDQHQIFVNAIDRTNEIVKNVEKVARGKDDDPIEQPRYMRQAETAEKQR